MIVANREGEIVRSPFFICSLS